MTDNQTDLTFFTNEADQTLRDRFKATLKDTRLFDVLVGYFRAGMLESWGWDIERIVQACKDAASSAPELRHEQTGLWVNLAFVPAEAETGKRKVRRKFWVLSGRIPMFQPEASLNNWA